MHRRLFLNTALVTAAAGVAACTTTPEELAMAVAADSSLPTLNWQMATSWPPAAELVYGSAQKFAEVVGVLSGGKFVIDMRAAGELAPPLEVMNVVEQGAVPCGHTASYYYMGKSPVTAFGTGLPFGLNDRQSDGWFHGGGGLELLQEYYAERFGLIQFPAGNSGVQMGGWFNREIKSLADLQGLKMRIAGLGGQILDRLGVTVQVLPGGEIFQALQSGAIDAAEWIGPYDDLKLNFHNAARYYYYPGWWEPGASAEVQINLQEWNALPEEYQEVIRYAAFAVNTIMLAQGDVKNPEALQTLLQKPDLELLPFPDDFMDAAESESFATFAALSAADSDFGFIFEHWNQYRTSVQTWHSLAEAAMMMRYITR